ncbi:MAG: hypothetical protein JSS78_04215 [Bacteroidetes bacterium]|nr:hypothetical protein [Bacteroidota bacterium]
MNKVIYLVALMIISIGLGGCPYESAVPISSAAIPVDPRFLGKWNSKDEVYNNYQITQSSPTQYHVVQKNISQTAQFTAFLSEVKGALFMNLYSDSTKAYYLFRIKPDTSGNKFTLTPIAAELPEHFNSSEALKSFVEKNMNLQSFYDETDRAEYEKIPTGSHTVLN